MEDFKKYRIDEELEFSNTKQYFWVSNDVIISGFFEGFNKACRFKYDGKYAIDNKLCHLYMIPKLSSRICREVTL